MSRPRRDACLVRAGTAVDHGDSMTNTALTLQQPLVTPTAEPWAARHLPRLAALAGSAWMALGIESIVRQDPHNYRDVLMYGPWVLLLATIVGIHQRQRHRAGRIERVGYVLMTSSMAVAVVLGILMLLGLVDGYFAVTMPVWILSMIMFGVGTARAGVFPRWMGVAIALAQPLAMATGVALSPWIGLHERGSFSGAVAHGTVLFAIAWACRVTDREPQL